MAPRSGRGRQGRHHDAGRPESRDPRLRGGIRAATVRLERLGQGLQSRTGDLCPVDCYDDVLVTDEFEPTKPGAHQLKFYARGIGNIRTGWRGSDPEKEVLALSRIVHLTPAELEKTRAQALTLEVRASVYGTTPPSEPRPTD
jgi:hypothetical protein